MSSAADLPMTTARDARDVDFPSQVLHGLRTLVHGLASLRLTVALFSLSFVLIVIGTLAQTEKNMWQVLSDYFRTYVTWVDFRFFTPQPFFPDGPTLPGGIYFPGGKTLGILLMVNLVAAHAVRFRVQAKGRERLLGLAILTGGLLLTFVVVQASQNQDGLQGQPWISYDAFWQILRASGVLAFVASIFTLVRRPANSWLAFWLRLSTVALTAGLCLLLLVWGGQQRLSDASMRILWQLGQSLGAAAIVLCGGLFLFRKRAGVVVIHLGVGLLMIGEMVVGMYAVEQRISLAEGAATNFARQTNALEIAFIDRSDPEYDTVVAIPISRLFAEETVTLPGHPVRLSLVKWMPHTFPPRSVTTKDKNLATAGTGRTLIVEPARGAGGASAKQKEDVAGAYVRVTTADGTVDDVYLLSQYINDAEGLFFGIPDQPERMHAGDQTYELSLRLRRIYKPYTIFLRDADSKSYLGTNRPKDYSSYIDLIDDRDVTQLSDYRIWMNNPLRYGGETFYQSGFHSLPAADGKGRLEATTLAVVSNRGWMIPYLSCAYVFLGMLVHFGGTLTRFLRRQEEEDQLQSSQGFRGRGWLAAGIVCLFAGIVVWEARPPRVGNQDLDWESFRKVPVVFGGRIQPIDTLARTSLMAISNRQSVAATRPEDGRSQNQSNSRSAVQWLLDVATRSGDARQARVFRIENLAVQQLLGVQRRPGLRYSIAEIEGKLNDFSNAARAAATQEDKDASQLTNDQRKILQVANRLQSFIKLQVAFEPTEFPSLPSQDQPTEEVEKQFQELTDKAVEAMERARNAKAGGIPLLVPGNGEDDWLPFGSAIDRAYLARLMQGTEPDARVLAWSQMLESYRDGDAASFNKAVATYHHLLRKQPPAGIDFNKVNLEVLFNRVQPFYVCMAAYVLAFVMVAVSWIRGRAVLQSASFWLLVAACILHTIALAARIYISGRPPVTSLYSSAIFIGWAVVILGLIYESIFKIGIGLAMSAAAGFSTLIIAHYLGLSGDTFTVLEAVLDTQFWLATHVVSITLGYGATFAAGLIAMAAIINCWLPGQPLPSRTLQRMIYGILCFAIFFSFVGTVLGGLWADDSWGRFWGWDPKENGALMIVLWNAIILHARWGGMIRERGTAVLAVLGNIVTAWSWFGVNELNIGLHSYGFTEGTLRNLSLFAIGNLICFVLGLVATWPKNISSPRATVSQA